MQNSSWHKKESQGKIAIPRPLHSKQSHSKSLKQILVGWMILQTVMAGTSVLAKGEDKVFTYGQLLEKIDRGQVTKVEIDPALQRARVTLVGQGEKDPAKEVKLLEQNPELIAKLQAKNVEFEIQPSADNSATVNLMTNLLVVFLLLGLVLMILRRSANMSGQAMNFGKSRARFQMEAKTGITFNEVAGIEEAKEELQEVVTFLKTPERFTAIGAKIPRGVLLIGDPGTGKTLLAKAIAGEAGVPFFSVSGSEFVEMFVGVGASRVRDLFRKAKENAPCLVFIDEIDAVGRQRGVGYGGGNDEREQTLNQLLTEMDGFEGNAGIIVIAATNRPDVLDLALLRPGRFDRQVIVDYPDYQGRLEILEVHARNKKVSPDVSLEVVARRTTGMTGADLANILNEAAIFTARRRKEAITMKEINDAIDRVKAGMEGKPVDDGKNKRMTAYHEVGHAIVGTLCPDHDPVEKVTILPRGQALGLTWFIPAEGSSWDFPSRSKLLAHITGTLGGLAAEACIFGESEITTGASSDIEQLTSLARRMVTRWGMSDLGQLALDDDYSEDIASQIDAQIRAIVKQCYEKAKQIIQDNRATIDHLVDILIEQETLEGDEFRKIVTELIPKNNLSLAKSL